MSSDASNQNIPGRYSTIVVADAQPLVREGMKALAASMLADAQFREAQCAQSLFDAASGTPPARLVITDIAMPGMQSGLRLFELAQRLPALPLVIVSELCSGGLVRGLMRVPTVCAVLSKNAQRAELFAAITAGLQGKRVLPLPASLDRSSVCVGLTPRQQEIHNLIGQGLSNKVIADLLGISEGTVKNHITDIFRALNASSRIQVAQLVRTRMNPPLPGEMEE